MRNWILGMLFCCYAMAGNAAQCDFTPDESRFSFGFTGYGFADKSYEVKDNTFTDYTLRSDSGRLLNAEITIQTSSVDTSADRRNWARDGEWPEVTIAIRNSNIVNGLFRHFQDGKTIRARINAIERGHLQLLVTMNGVTRPVDMTYKLTDGILHAKGTLNLLQFDAEQAFRAFAAVCSQAWHRGKTWPDVEIYFSVAVVEDSCPMEG